MQPEVRDGYWALFDTTDVEAERGPRLVELIDQRIGASGGWRGVTMTPTATRLLQDLRRSLLEPARLLRPTEDRVPDAPPDLVSASA
jgi:hypothetical protein